MATDDAVKKSMFQTLQYIVETEGVGALYRGIVPVVVGAAPAYVSVCQHTAPAYVSVCQHTMATDDAVKKNTIQTTV